jgi:hypothetical protein
VDLNVFIAGQISMQYQNPTKMVISIPMIAATMIRKKEERPTDTVSYLSGDERNLVFQQIYPTNARYYIAPSVPDFWINQEGRLMSGWTGADQSAITVGSFYGPGKAPLSATWLYPEAVVQAHGTIMSDYATVSIPTPQSGGAYAYAQFFIGGTGGDGGVGTFTGTGGGGGSGGYKTGVVALGSNVTQVKYIVSRDLGYTSLTFLDASGNPVGLTHYATNGGRGGSVSGIESLFNNGTPGRGGSPNGTDGDGVNGSAMEAFKSLDIIDENGVGLLDDGPWISKGSLLGGPSDPSNDPLFGGGAHGTGALGHKYGAPGFVAVAFYGRRQRWHSTGPGG